MKHFALNDCEQDRIGLGVWLTEQAAREVYLKAFQDVFEEEMQTEPWLLTHVGDAYGPEVTKD